MKIFKIKILKNFNFFLLRIYTIFLNVLILNLYILIKFRFLKDCVIMEFVLLNLNRMNFSASILIDELTLRFLFTISLIRIRVITFSNYYLNTEQFSIRFHLILFLFITSIFLIIVRANLVITILGWDGLGLRSYFLVTYYNNKKSSNAGILTVLRNRIGDGFLVLTIMYLLSYGDWQIKFYHYFIYNNLIIILLILGCFTKSAQIPFRAWLPAAIAAPTPVSALVHSSTLVTAGVYLLIRHESIFSQFRLIFIIIVGLLTTTIASFRALLEMDLKKIVALSTLSQLGFIVISLGFQEFHLAYIHLIAHAFFKALLFLRAGLIIHNSSSYQDLRFINQSFLRTPVRSLATVIALIRLCGIPFITSFYSKETIIESSLINRKFIWVYFILIINVGLTLRYRIKFFIIGTINQSLKNFLLLTNEKNYFYLWRIWILLLPAFLAGYRINFLFLNKALFIKVPQLIKLLTILVLRLRLIIRYNLFIKLKKYKFSISKNSIITIWILPYLSTYVFTQISLKLLKWLIVITEFIILSNFLNYLIIKLNFISLKKTNYAINSNLYWKNLYTVMILLCLTVLFFVYLNSL